VFIFIFFIIYHRLLKRKERFVDPKIAQKAAELERRAKRFAKN
jgi:hypothetical protein